LQSCQCPSLAFGEGTTIGESTLRNEVQRGVYGVTGGPNAEDVPVRVPVSGATPARFGSGDTSPSSGQNMTRLAGRIRCGRQPWLSAINSCAVSLTFQTAMSASLPCQKLLFSGISAPMLSRCPVPVPLLQFAVY